MIPPYTTEEFIKISQTKHGDYCLTNNIKLVRIPYTEMSNINSILDKELQIES